MAGLGEARRARGKTMPGTLIRLAGEFAVCRLGPTEPVPCWVKESGFFSVTRTDDELSILCPAADVPVSVKQERGWRLLKLQGTFAFTETGVLLSILRPLAA